MSQVARWLLPENVADVLPEQARAIEDLRGRLLGLYRTWGYELVMPPLLEHLESLLTGSGHDLGLRTVQLVDQLSGRILGLRADTTPQVARIDSHILNRSGVVRLCYAGPTLHARPMHPMASREPYQVGAEIFGDASMAADRESLELAVATARLVTNGSVQLDLGHTGVLRALLGEEAAARQATPEILAALAAKDGGALAQAAGPLGHRRADALQALIGLNGGIEVIARARRSLPDEPAIGKALDELEQLAQGAAADALGIDLADPHGFAYHSGAGFAVHVTGLGGPLLRGGRYDSVGAAFGRARAASGFSLLDLREAARLSPLPAQRAILAPPAGGDPALETRVAQLRAQGEVVLRAEPGSEPGVNWVTDRRLLVAPDGQWVLE
jgi:ATP phosphoribosyltransferase regulatory subunit